MQFPCFCKKSGLGRQILLSRTCPNKKFCHRNNYYYYLVVCLVGWQVTYYCTYQCTFCYPLLVWTTRISVCFAPACARASIACSACRVLNCTARRHNFSCTQMHLSSTWVLPRLYKQYQVWAYVLLLCYFMVPDTQELREHQDPPKKSSFIDLILMLLSYCFESNMHAQY